ncbi:MAG: hypothetical protein U1F55_06155 [Chitinivorax sp.]
MMVLRMVTSVWRLFSPDGLSYIFAFGGVSPCWWGRHFLIWSNLSISSVKGCGWHLPPPLPQDMATPVPTTPISRVFSVFLVLAGYSMIAP